MRTRSVVALVLLALAHAARAEESVLFEVQGKDKVLGTIRPAAERESILCNLVKGTTLKASVKSTQKTGPVPTLDVTLNDLPVAGVTVTVKGRGAAIAPFVAPATGTYKVSVLGDSVKDGDYQFAVSWAAQKVFSGTGTSAGETLFPFAAPLGSSVTVTLAAAPGSAFVPHLLSLDGPSMATFGFTGGGKAGPVALPSRGDWNVRFRSDAADDAYKISVKVAAPKPPKHSIDIRDSALGGAFNGGSSVYGAVLDPATGGEVGVTDPGSPIAGSSVSVPPDSLGQSTGIFVAQSAPYTPPGGAHPAGPAVEFGPSGTQFDPNKPATVTIPYDPNQFPVDTSSLVVYVRDANGVVTAVPGPYTFGTGTVTFTTSHFSTFMAATTGPRAEPSGTFVALGVGGTPFTGLAGDVTVTTGSVALTRGLYNNSLNTASVEFGPPNSDNIRPYAYVTFSSDSAAGATVSIDDETSELRDLSGALSGTLRRGRRDDVLVVEHVPGNSLRTLALFRRPVGRPTLNTLAGRWHAFVWEFRAEPVTAPDTDLGFTAVANTGTATIAATGGVTIQFTGAVERTTRFPGGVWRTDTTGSSKQSGQISLDEAGGPILHLDTAAASPIYPTPVMGGDVMFAAVSSTDLGLGPSGAQVGLLVFVRQSVKASIDDIAGTMFDVAGGIDVHEGKAPNDQLGLSWRVQAASTQLSTDRAFATNGLLCLSGYSAGGFDPTSTTNTYAEPAGATWSFSSDGRFGISRLGVTGAVLPSGDFGFYLLRGGSGMLVGFALRR